MAKKIRKNVVLDEPTDKIVKREAHLYGSNFSDTLRRIIFEWNRSNNPETVIIGGEPAEEK